MLACGFTPSTLIELLTWRARYQPDQRIYTFLLNGEMDEVHLTYKELDRQARLIGSHLQHAGVIGERALLLYPPGLEYITAFFGCLYAGVVAVPAYPPDPTRLERTLPRLSAIVNDARPLVVLTTGAIQVLAGALSMWAPDLESVRWLATDTLADRAEERWRMPAADGDTLALLQYTSGSTAAPKGVRLTHANLLHNSALIQRGFAHTSASCGVIWLPPYHDMGLIGGIIQPLYAGFPVTLFSPVDFLQRPLLWLQTISRTRATTSGGPNFAYDLCVRKIAPEQREALDLSSWTVAFNGAEPVRPATLERFAMAFAPCGFRAEAFYPCYGLAEASLIVTGGHVSMPPAIRVFRGADLEQNQAIPTQAGQGTLTLVGSGQPLLNQQIAIVHPESLMSCAAGQVGEIWVAGPSIASGYWNRPAETERTFRARPADSGQGPFLRTGDLGFMHDGELFVTGRLKDSIIIRGRNHHPQDIELTIERSHPALRPGCGAAFMIEVDGEERLVVAQEIERQYRHADMDKVAWAMRRAVAEQHELQIHTVLLLNTGSIPKTSSGKIQRHACRSGFLADTLEVVHSSILEDIEEGEGKLTGDMLLMEAPQERQRRLEFYLCKQLARMLRVALERVDPQQPIGVLGLDSLMAVELQHRIEADLEIVLSMANLLQGKSICQLAMQALEDLAVASRLKAMHAVAEEPVTTHPLTPGQQALWMLQELAPKSSAYTIASAVRIRVDLDILAFRRSFQRLVDRHEALRTTFSVSHGALVQEVQADAEVCFNEVDASSWDEAALKDRLDAEAYRSFDLMHGPMLRVHLFTRRVREHVLLLAVHHMVADLWSLAVLAQELGMLYQEETSGVPASLNALTLRYTDYVHWQADMLAGPEGARLWAYWQQQLAGELQVLDLPTDYPRPAVQTYGGAAHAFMLDTQVTAGLKALGKQLNTTLYMTLLAAFQVLLYRYTGQEDILVGSPTTGRSRADLAGIVGYFVNPIVLRSQLSSQLQFTALLKQVRETVLAALAYQEFPFATLVERLQPNRDLSRSPLVHVLFTLQKAPLYTEQGLAAVALGVPQIQMNMCDLLLESIALTQRTSQFELMLQIAEMEEGLVGSWQYNTDLFEATTIVRMAGHFHTLLEAILADPEQHLRNLPLLTTAEREQLLVTWNATQAAYPHDACIHELFQAQVAWTPDAIGLVFENAYLTYRELNRRANQLAHHLRTLGIESEVRVCICLERSLELVIGLLGILKAGGVYVPLDPTYPQERLAFMLEDSMAPVLLTQERLVDDLPISWAYIVCLDSNWDLIAQQPTDDPSGQFHPANLAYMIYTSGSTGQPKGVLIPHQGLVNYISWCVHVYAIEEGHGAPVHSSLSFDLTITSLFAPLLTGQPTVLLPEDVGGTALNAALRTGGDFSFVKLTPTHLELLNQTLPAEEAHGGSRALIIGGEALRGDMLAFWRAHAPDTRLINEYGPTETVVGCCVYEVPAGDVPAGDVPIGRPIVNVQLYLLDHSLQLVPIGVPGELCIGGVGLARGYHNRPDLTAERFIPNPFVTIKDSPSPSSFVFHPSPGTRLYKTGDLARYRANGVIEFLGRSDQQVKLRGNRIELGEIERVLARHPVICESVVVAREDTPGDVRLVAYVVLTDQTQNAERRTLKETATERDDSSFIVCRSSFGDQLRSFLKERLPDYMVPSAFVLLSHFPLTSNGKLDRRALPAPEALPREQERTYVAPRTEAERIIAAVWYEVLGLDEPGVYDNFFDLGGNSILMVRVHQRLREILGRDISMVDLFEHPTIDALAGYLSQGEHHRSELQPDDRLAGTLVQGKNRLKQRLNKNIERRKR